MTRPPLPYKLPRMDPDDAFPPGTPSLPYLYGQSGYHSYNEVMGAEALDQKYSVTTFNSYEEVERLREEWADVSQAIWRDDEEREEISTTRSVYVPIGPFDQETVVKALLHKELPGYPHWIVQTVHSLGPNSDKVLVVLGRKK